jgi:hypothetical protein
VDWQLLAPDFRPDGSLRDIYVLGTGLPDWQQVLDMVRRWAPKPTFAIDGEPTPLPERVEEIFRPGREPSAVLSLGVGGVTLNCHFFAEEEIEFDFDPAEVTGSAQAEALANFMSLLGEATAKIVVLTMENSPAAVILRYSPDARAVEWANSQH